MHTKLRARTRHAHETAEQAMSLQCRLASLEAYGDLLVRLWSLHSAFELQLGKLSRATVDIDFDSRRRAHWLAEDIRHLGREPGAPRTLARSIDSMEEAIGALYVLEGSTLGGQVILRQAIRLPGISPTRGARFFWGHAEKTSSLWMAFIDVLNLVDPAGVEAELIEEAALRTFDEFVAGLRA